MKIKLKVRVAHKGTAEGEALVYQKPFVFGDINPGNGAIDVPGHELKGKSIKEKVLVFPCGCGASTEDWGMYVLARVGVGPKAIINGRRIFYIDVTGAILADIPMVYGLDQNFLSFIRNGDHIKVDGNNGIVEVTVK